MINIDDIDLEKEEFMDIFTFIKNKNVGIDVSSDWFQELWYPLSKKRGRTGPTPLQTQGCLEATLVQEQKQGINYNWLVKCVDAIIDHNDEFLLFVNLHRDQMVEDTMNNEPIC
jgi:hypothetical protein